MLKLLQLALCFTLRIQGRSTCPRWTTVSSGDINRSSVDSFTLRVHFNITSRTQQRSSFVSTSVTSCKPITLHTFLPIHPNLILDTAPSPPSPPFHIRSPRKSTSPLPLPYLAYLLSHLNPNPNSTPPHAGPVPLSHTPPCAPPLILKFAFSTRIRDLRKTAQTQPQRGTQRNLHMHDVT